jgi:hypothetical protein
MCICGMCHIYIFSFCICCRFKRKTEVQVIFLNPFTVCSLCIRKFVVCPFIDEETSRIYSFAIGLNVLNGLNGPSMLTASSASLVSFAVFHRLSLSQMARPCFETMPYCETSPDLYCCLFFVRIYRPVSKYSTS